MFDIVKMLKLNNARVHKADRKGSTPLHIAGHQRIQKITRYIGY